MASRFYKWAGKGEVAEIRGLDSRAEAHAIHQDTLAVPLKHPVTGRVHDSKSSYMRDCALTGTRVVGNDWLNVEGYKPKDKITDELIMDRMQKAEAILRDPAKRRERENENRLRYETAQKFMRRGKIEVERIRD